MQIINRSDVVEVGGSVGGMNLQSTEDLETVKLLYGTKMVKACHYPCQNPWNAKHQVWTQTKLRILGDKAVSVQGHQS